MAIWQIVLENETSWHPGSEVRDHLDRIWEVMQACVKRGLATEGILPRRPECSSASAAF